MGKGTMRGFLGVIFIAAVLVTLVAGLDVLEIEGKAGATVFQQIVARVTFGLSALICTVAAGFLVVTAQANETHERIETALKDIAASNADSANAIKNIAGFVESRIQAARAANTQPSE